MNELEVIFSARVYVPDKRYRILVSFIRADRPKYWAFRCLNCGSKIGDIQNSKVISLDDFYDPQNTNNQAVVHHCKGTLSDGLPCQYSYAFNIQ